MEVCLDKRVKRKMIEINKIPFQPPNIAVTAVKPEKLVLMLFSVRSYGIMRTPPVPLDPHVASKEPLQGGEMLLSLPIGST